MSTINQLITKIGRQRVLTALANVVCNVTSSSGSGDVTGPASSTDNGLVLFNGTTGKIIKDMGITLPAALQSVRRNAAGTAWEAVTTTDNPMTAKGDIIQASDASGTPARLPIGSAAQQLRVNSAGDLAEWFTPTSGTYPIKLFHNNVAQALTPTVSETIMTQYSFLIPAGTMQANDTLVFIVKFSRTGTTNTFTLQVTFNTSLSLTGDTLFAVLAVAAAQKWSPLRRSIEFKNSLAVQRVFSTALNTTTDDEAAQSNSIHTSLTQNFAVDQYMQTTLFGNGTTDTGSIESMEVYIIR